MKVQFSTVYPVRKTERSSPSNSLGSVVEAIVLRASVVFS